MGAAFSASLALAMASAAVRMDDAARSLLCSDLLLQLDENFTDGVGSKRTMLVGDMVRDTRGFGNLIMDLPDAMLQALAAGSALAYPQTHRKLTTVCRVFRCSGLHVANSSDGPAASRRRLEAQHRTRAAECDALAQCATQRHAATPPDQRSLGGLYPCGCNRNFRAAVIARVLQGPSVPTALAWHASFSELWRGDGTTFRALVTASRPAALFDAGISVWRSTVRD